MTALKEYTRLEGIGLWRLNEDDQRREVIVSLGEATLSISDSKSLQFLSHWSLAAIARQNPGLTPAIFHPDGDEQESLELGPDEAELITAIEKLRLTVERRRPHPGRLRWGIRLASVSLVALLGFFWLPDALEQHAARVLPPVKRAEIGNQLLAEIEHVAGTPCDDPAGSDSLNNLARRLFGAANQKIVVMRSGVRETAHLPGGQILLDRSLVELNEDPTVVAGYVVAEDVRRRAEDPMIKVLRSAGFFATFRLLTTGDLSQDALRNYATQLVTAKPDPIPADDLIAAFAAANLRSSPYAYAVDITGEDTQRLIDLDPMQGKDSQPVMNDQSWLALQSICSN